MRPSELKSQEARRKAQEQLAKIKQRDALALIETRKAQKMEYEKTERLRTLRLAKEAADRAAAAKSALEAKLKPPRRKRFDDALRKVASQAATG